MTLGVAPAPTLVGRHGSLRALLPATATAIACHANDLAVAHLLVEGFAPPYTLAVAQAWCVDPQPATGLRPCLGGRRGGQCHRLRQRAARQRLYAPIFERNAGSQGAERRAGFRLEQRLPRSRVEDSEVIDSVLWGAYRLAAVAAGSAA